MANIYYDDADGKMAFSSFKTIGEVLKAFQVTYTAANFISEQDLRTLNGKTNHRGRRGHRVIRA